MINIKKHKLINFFLFQLMLISFSSCGQTPPNKYEEKEVVINQVIKLSPGQLFVQGMEYYNKGHYAKAIITFKKTIESDSQYLKAYNFLGLAYDEQGNYEQAIAAFNSVLKINPQYVDALANRGREFSIIGKYRESIADFNRVIKLRPSLELAYFGRGRSYYDLGEYQKALKDYEHCIRLAPRDGSAYHEMGVVKQALKDINGACEAWKKGIEVGSESSKMKYNSYCKK